MVFEQTFYFYLAGSGRSGINFLNFFENCGIPNFEKDTNHKTWSDKDKNKLSHQVAFDGVGADLAVEGNVRSFPAKLSFDKTNSDDLGLNNYDKHSPFLLTNVWRGLTGSGMNHLCKFIIDFIEYNTSTEVLDKHQVDRTNHDIKLYFFSYSRGAFNVLKIISEDKHKDRLKKLYTQRKLRKLELVCFLCDPVPGPGNNNSSYKISSFVKKLNIYSAINESSIFFGSRFYKDISFESVQTKYCIHSYSANHATILNDFISSVSNFFKINYLSESKSRSETYNLHWFKKAKNPLPDKPIFDPQFFDFSSKRNYQKFIMNKGNRLFLNLSSQYIFKTFCPNLYKFMGFEQLFFDQEALTLSFQNSLQQEYIYLIEEGLVSNYYKDFFNSCIYNDKQNYPKHMQNIAFIYQLDLLYVNGEHNLKNMDEFYFLSSKTYNSNSMQLAQITTSAASAVQGRALMSGVSGLIASMSKVSLPPQGLNLISKPFENMSFLALKKNAFKAELRTCLLLAIEKNSFRFNGKLNSSATFNYKMLPQQVKEICDFLTSSDYSVNKLYEILKKYIVFNFLSPKDDFMYNFYYYYFNYIEHGIFGNPIFKIFLD